MITRETSPCAGSFAEEHVEETAALAGLGLVELEKVLYPLPPFRIRQIYKWIIRGVSGFQQMTDIPNVLREDLEKRFCLFSGTVKNQYNDNNTKKIILALKDGLDIEAVLIRDGKKRNTACLSTQAGCPIGCVFCKTGRLGFKRNLDSAEIVEQFIFLLMEAAKEKRAENQEKHVIENIVIMGMGEPLLNLISLRKAIAILNDKQGFNFSKRRITVSTCGICGGLFDIAENGPYVRLALSLTTADTQLREKLMPGIKHEPLVKIKEALILFQKNGGGRITLEIPLLKDLNTRDKDIFSIAAFAKGIDSIINIIPWNPIAGFEFEGNLLHEPGKNEISDFAGKLENLGLKVTKRLRKGCGVMGACGQLGT
ncbi:MAG: 23S rRNA (adenine(2503)-C(2))-methyltransferase RlmN [Treponema sp.]|jgi:23S rRNA (adenine2503-C2)-methyltransferase|nr:23S rRNA (adenine(2503)-C(2))-methyltransferase RlmN [Treponema sp.]